MSPSKDTCGTRCAGPDWVDAELTLDNFPAGSTTGITRSEEPAERASRLKMPRLIDICPDKVQLAGDDNSPPTTVAVADTFDGWRLAETLTEPEPMAVLEREFDRWGLIVYVGKQGVVAEIRKAVGRLSAIERPCCPLSTRLLPSNCSIPRRCAGQEGARCCIGDPSYEDVAGYLAPLQAYTFLGTPESPKKYAVQPDGSIGLLPNRWGANKPLETTLFDPKNVVSTGGSGV